MMRETSLDQHAGMNNSSITGNKPTSTSAAAVVATSHETIQKDISHPHRKTKDEEEEKKDDESSRNNNANTPPPAAVKPTPQQKQPRQQQQQQKPAQAKDYLRHVTSATAGQSAKRAGTSWWERVVVQRSSYVVEDLVEQYSADSAFLKSQPLPVAFMDRIEVETGELLGSGTYSNVSRVTRLQWLQNFLIDHPHQNRLRQELLEQGQLHASATQSPYSATPSTGYAIKHLKAELLQNSKLFEAAAADLIMEAKFLARLDHPNILRLRGMALGGTSTFAATGLFDSYFLVVDEVQETLIQRIHRWKLQGSTDQYRPGMILHKLKLAVQIASALAYLHERRLVFRDLKPHNVGLKMVPVSNKKTGGSHSQSAAGSYHDPNDAATVIQLFDFGFCRELPAPSTSVQHRLPTMISANNKQSSHDGKDAPTLGGAGENRDATETFDTEEDDDEIYCMSGKGTLLYMASEVLATRCYNRKADVYSWSMVTYELLTLQKPYAVGSIEQHKKAVCDRGERPPLNHLRWLDSPVKELLQHSWQADVQARWHMRDVQEGLEGIISNLERSQNAFPTAGSFGSFGGYSSGKNPSSSSYFCQGVDVNDIILDITNAAQTRYEYITETLLCGGVKNATTDSNMDGKMGPAMVNKSSTVTTASLEESVGIGEEMTLKGYMNATQGSKSLMSVSFKEPSEVISNTLSNKVANDGNKEGMPVQEVRVPTGKEEHKHEPFTASAALAAAQSSLSMSIWNGTNTNSLRIPVTSTKEQFPMTSLAMNSVRLNAARSRKATASVNLGESSMALASMSISNSARIASHSLSAFEYDEFGRARATNNPISKLEQTIELRESMESTSTRRSERIIGRNLSAVKSGDEDEDGLAEVSMETDITSKASRTPSRVSAASLSEDDNKLADIGDANKEATDENRETAGTAQKSPATISNASEERPGVCGGNVEECDENTVQHGFTQAPTIESSQVRDAIIAACNDAAPMATSVDTAQATVSANAGTSDEECAAVGLEKRLEIAADSKLSKQHDTATAEQHSNNMTDASADSSANSALSSDDIDFKPLCKSEVTTDGTAAQHEQMPSASDIKGDTTQSEEDIAFESQIPDEEMDRSGNPQDDLIGGVDSTLS